MPSFSIEKGNLSFKTTKKHSALASDRSIDLKVKKKGANRIHTVIGEKNSSNARKPRTSYRTNVIKQHGFNKQAQAVIKVLGLDRFENQCDARLRFIDTPAFSFG